MGKGGDSAPPFGQRKPGQEEAISVHLYGKKVDVSKFSKTHPGGAKALRIFDNRDATEQFEMYHSPAGARRLAQLRPHTRLWRALPHAARVWP